jgi:hypothetical protein
VALPAMSASDRNLLVRAAAAANNIQLTGLGPASPVLKVLGRNPAAILSQVRRALAAGCVTSAELEAFVSRAGTAIGQDD